MLTGFYSNISGMYYNEQQLANVSNNLANADTTSFRRSMMMLRTREENPSTKWVDSQVKDRLPTQYGVQRAGVFNDYETTGTLKATDSPMNIAIPTELKNAFFAVKRLDSNDQNTYYTRNGTLSMGPSNPADPASEPALYISGQLAAGADGQPIHVDPLAGPLSINAEGIISQGNDEVGQIPVYRLNKSSDPTSEKDADLQRLEQLGDSLYKIPDDAKGEFYAKRLVVGEAGVSRLTLQGMSEGSNVNPMSEMVDMIDVTKSFEANSRAVRTQVDGLLKLFQLVRK